MIEFSINSDKRLDFSVMQLLELYTVNLQPVCMNSKLEEYRLGITLEALILSCNTAGYREIY